MEQQFIGKTIDDAKAQASVVFGAPQEKITFTILEEPKKSFFGKIKGEAKVNAVYQPSKADIACAYVKDVLSKLSETADIVVKQENEGLNIEIVGDASGTIIGRRGETLDALQYLTSMACNKSDREYFRITIDSCGYREKRKQTLIELAGKIAKSVAKTGRPCTLEPMNPYERRIIHSAISEIEGVSSRSIGEDPFRKVVISSDQKVFRPRSRGNRDGNKDNKGRYNKNFKKERTEESSAHIDLTTSFEKDYVKPVPKPKPEDSMSSELYGKIKLD